MNNQNERPSKPADSLWTDDQWKAITADGNDILVAAAAGSGKTAVLVERIIRKIISEDNPLDVDRLLIATFTNASAAEMRHRIAEALEKYRGEHKILLTYSPDHGQHPVPGNRGSHGSKQIEDMNVLHFFGTICQERGN